MIPPLVETTRTDVSPTFNSCKEVSLCTCHKCSVRETFFSGRSAYITKKSQPVWHKHWLNLVFKQEFVKKRKRKKTKNEPFFRLKLMHVTSNKNLLIYILSCVNLWKNVLLVINLRLNDPRVPFVALCQLIRGRCERMFYINLEDVLSCKREAILVPESDWFIQIWYCMYIW